MSYSTQNQLLLNKLMEFYKKDNNIDKILPIINGEHKVSLRLIDWFVTNYSKKHYTWYNLNDGNKTKRFKVYVDYKLKLKAYSKKRFDPFCRWDRIVIPYGEDENVCIQTTLGQLNFFRWAVQYKILDYIEENFKEIDADMNSRNSSSKNRSSKIKSAKTRKKRKELSVSATKSIKKEEVEIIVKFD